MSGWKMIGYFLSRQILRLGRKCPKSKVVVMKSGRHGGVMDDHFCKVQVMALCREIMGL